MILTLLEAVAAVIITLVIGAFLAVLTAGAGWAWERRGPTRLDRVLAQCERDREDLAAMEAAAKALFREAVVQARADELADDPALWESMERRVEQ